MKSKASIILIQFLVLLMAVLFLLLMVNSVRAQTSSSLPGAVIAQTNNQANFQNQTGSQGQILQLNLPKKSMGQRIWDDTSLSYYQQFLGPTPSGRVTETYNIFQEGIDSPNSGRAPLQSFHALNLRHRLNSDWAIGATLSAVNGYTDEVTNKDKNGYTFQNTPATDFFNARAYVSLPALNFKLGSLFSTLSYEAPTSSISKLNNMQWGWVIAESFALSLPNPRWNAGLVGQIYRMNYRSNKDRFNGSLQTTIVSVGPYANYRFSDKWMLGGVVTLDWDQRGSQTGTTEFNNNLPHRGRLNLTYFPQKIKFLQTVGIFSQALLKYSNETTAFGLDFTVKF